MPVIPVNPSNGGEGNVIDSLGTSRTEAISQRAATDGIKSIRGTIDIGSLGEIVTNQTLKDFIVSIAQNSVATAGNILMGEVHLTDFPNAKLTSAEIEVKIHGKNKNESMLASVFLTSSNVPPYLWAIQTLSQRRDEAWEMEGNWTEISSGLVALSMGEVGNGDGVERKELF